MGMLECDFAPIRLLRMVGCTSDWVHVALRSSPRAERAMPDKSGGSGRLSISERQGHCTLLLGVQGCAVLWSIPDHAGQP
jgi:hypothetical protein